MFKIALGTWLYRCYKHCVKSVRIRSFSEPYFPAFWEKIRTRKTPNTDTFHAVKAIKVISYNIKIYLIISSTFILCQGKKDDFNSLVDWSSSFSNLASNEIQMALIYLVFFSAGCDSRPIKNLLKCSVITCWSKILTLSWNMFW